MAEVDLTDCNYQLLSTNDAKTASSYHELAGGEDVYNQFNMWDNQIFVNLRFQDYVRKPE